MTNFLSDVAARAFPRPDAIQPRLPTLFERVTPDDSPVVASDPVAQRAARSTRTTPTMTTAETSAPVNAVDAVLRHVAELPARTAVSSQVHAERILAAGEPVNQSRVESGEHLQHAARTQPKTQQTTNVESENIESENVKSEPASRVPIVHAHSAAKSTSPPATTRIIETSTATSTTSRDAPLTQTLSSEERGESSVAAASVPSPLRGEDRVRGASRESHTTNHEHPFEPHPSQPSQPSPEPRSRRTIEGRRETHRPTTDSAREPSAPPPRLPGSHRAHIASIAPPPPEPNITISIGRVEVRAAVQSQRTTAPVVSREPSLDEYLSRRERRHGR